MQKKIVDRHPIVDSHLRDLSKNSRVVDMNFLSGVVICWGPFKVLGMEEDHNTGGKPGYFPGRKALIWFGYVEFSAV